MPISRKKACTRCRTAKARCSLALPRCSRCVERGLQCEYFEYDSRLGSYSEATAAPTETPSLSPDLILETQYPSQMEVLPPDPASGEMMPQSTRRLDWDSVTLSNLHSERLLTPNSTLDAVSPLLGFPGGFNQAMNGPHPNTTLAGTDQRSDRFSITTQSQRGSNALKLRPSVTPTEFFTTKIMLGQIESYPRMMIEGHTLPPFIHSRCALDDALSNECCSRKTHQCLPQTLSICASLVQLFYTKNSTNSDFVWKTIYAEHKRLHNEHESFNGERLLEALQAICIYVILQAQDHESTGRNDGHSFIKAMSDIASRYNEVYGYDGYGMAQGKQLNRSIWIFQESTRRTGCLLYIIETLLDVIIGRDRDPISCMGYALMPLPCVKGLWEAKSTSEWAARYKEVSARWKTNEHLKLMDLKECMTLSTSHLNGKKGSEGILSDVMTWCEGLDQYGTLVWMAAMLSKC